MAHRRGRRRGLGVPRQRLRPPQWSLHEVVALLTAGDQASTSPQPSLDDLPELLGRAKSINPDVTFAMGTRPDVSPAVGMALYRVVQESLTNAHRYAPGARIDVALAAADGRVRLTVANAAPTGPDPGISGSGTGVQGMRMRCELLGGQLAAGPHGDG